MLCYPTPQRFLHLSEFSYIDLLRQLRDNRQGHYSVLPHFLRQIAIALHQRGFD